MTKSSEHSRNSLYLHRMGYLVLLILLFACHLWGQSTREYIYMDGKLLAVENNDNVDPEIFSIIDVQAIDVTSSSVIIIWITNRPSTSQIEYGTTTDYGNSTTLDSSMVEYHSQQISGLNSNTLYHYKVISIDEDENTAQSEDLIFTTQNIITFSITITSPTSDPATTTTQNIIVIGGTWSGGIGIPQITYTNDQGGNGNCQVVDEFNREWQCANIEIVPPFPSETQRDNVITINATDSADNHATDVLTVNRYDAGSIPVPALTGIRWKPLSKIEIDICSDNVHVDSVKLERTYRYSADRYYGITTSTISLPSACIQGYTWSYIIRNNVITLRVRGIKIAQDQTEIEGPWSDPISIRTRYTFDHDIKEDPTVWSPSTGTWLTKNSTNDPAYESSLLGQPGDKPLLGDFDGDSITDRAVYRPSTGYWYIHKSGSPGALTATQWGQEGDVPVPGDYDFDNKTDLAVWRPSTGIWYILKSSAPGTYDAIQWGLEAEGDIPVPADYDAHYDGGLDGVSVLYYPRYRADIAVWRPSTGTWYILKHDGTYYTVQLGASGDIPLAAVP